MYSIRSIHTGEIRLTNGETVMDGDDVFIRTINVVSKGPDRYGPDGICVSHAGEMTLLRWEPVEEWEAVNE